jgi:signal transduction histidine kinase
LPRPSDQHAYSRHFFFGLRPSLLGALTLTSVVTLSVAALALLPPLKSRLYSDALSQTESAVDLAKPGLTGIALVGGQPRPRQLRKQALAVKSHFKAERVIVLSTRLQALADTDPDEPLQLARSVAASSLRVKRAGKPQHIVHNGLLVVASPYDDHSVPLVLEIFARLDYVEQATDVVSDAFLEAAAAGLAVALLLGAALSERLVRRLRRLRDATSVFERGGFDEHDLTNLIVPDDLARDEIGELARAFASMRARLLKQEQARRAFVATASHELRTPLTSLDGMLELLADDLGSEQLDIEDARKRVALAQQQSRRLSNLATDLLDLSRIDSSLELRSEAVELGELARAVSAEFELRALERDVAVTIEGADRRCWAEGDPGGVARIVRILLDNALRIAPAHSTVTIAIANGAGHCTLAVSDRGPGVMADERELIFERFRRGTRRDGEGGFGLGLAIGRELAERMGGTLELRGDPPGATFRLTLAGAGRGAPAE